MTERRTIADLARAAGLSVSTIDRVMNGRAPVKRSTVEQVLSAAERIGYHGVSAIRSRLIDDARELTLGFLLISEHRRLYRQMADILRQVAAETPGRRIHVLVEHLEDIDPEAAARALLALGEKCAAIACICMDHPRINLAVAELARKGVPVIAMVSALSTTTCAAFIGSNDWQLGRTAGWFMRLLCPPEGKLAIIVGSERYLCQQVHETSFRSFIRANAPGLQIVETLLTQESDGGAAQAMVPLLREGQPDLAGIMVAGGGLEGVIDAIAQSSRPRPVLIGTELTDHIRSHLTTGGLDVVLSHPVTEIARQVVPMLIDLANGERSSPVAQQIIPFDILISENC